MKRYYTMNWLAGAASLLLLLGTVACNNGGGGGGSPAPVPAYGVVSGFTNGVAILNSVTSSSYYGDIAMQMALGQMGSGNQVGFQGTLNVNPGNISMCGAPAGSYSITTTQPGIMSGTSLGPMQLVASGPVQITMQVSYGIIENAGARVSFNMFVYVNGQPCDQLITL